MTTELLSERFLHREDTLGRPGRERHERARRSFFKFVAKEQLYWPLFYDAKIDWHTRMPSKHITTYQYSNVPAAGGMPTFREWRSEAYRVWQLRFKRHVERWENEEHEARIARIYAAPEAYNGLIRSFLHTKNVTKVFRALAAGGAINESR